MSVLQVEKNQDPKKYDLSKVSVRLRLHWRDTQWYRFQFSVTLTIITSSYKIQTMVKQIY